MTLSVIVSLLLWMPMDVGVYVTLMVQLAPPASEDPQVFVSAYCEPGVILVMLSVTVPALVSVAF